MCRASSAPPRMITQAMMTIQCRLAAKPPSRSSRLFMPVPPAPDSGAYDPGPIVTFFSRPGAPCQGWKSAHSGTVDLFSDGYLGGAAVEQLLGEPVQLHAGALAVGQHR